jgi:hypothetical protein
LAPARPDDGSEFMPARTRRDASILVLDGCAQAGAKILIAGGGRCNVTHDVVDERAFAGSSRNAIRKVLVVSTSPSPPRSFPKSALRSNAKKPGSSSPPPTTRARCSTPF